MTATVHLPIDLAGRIFQVLGAALPNEGCGLLIGTRDGARVTIADVIESPNLSVNAPKAFEIDPGLRLRTQRAARAEGLEIVGHFHSHPFGQPVPSDCDRAEAHEPDLVWLIMGLRWGGPEGLAAWRLAPESAPERLDLEIVD
ncbi:M67 family metallopeptidase [Minwuia sp.]|uniref:M67 family metallopeptidase n=1 Tax=Minwuia sp. TaxID=2493630 RepID=UPI003A90F060